ncbi:hypothetical protein [Jejuia spongiicola]|uniref:DUF4476 domain-containing protein n=1 Tax=Jejuia spongiicola TaxID=2942207 RepID=A0ABT0QDT9_9FLAO|nr:hypothetical protein [Jejuia spongiicola]MCL6295100.1 hypothetical protein [Jejuia spongiicola]
MNKFLLLICISLLISCQTKKEQNSSSTENKSNAKPETRWVKDNVITSNDLPKIEIKVDKEFDFVDKFDFEIIANSNEYPPEMQGKAIASGERYVFISTDKKHHVNKLFIVQFEGFFPDNDLIYNYNFDNVGFIGDNKYRHNTWYYDTNELVKENPSGEWAKTISFLNARGFHLEDYVMMSRYVGLASDDRKNEIIIFYHEMLEKTTGYSLDEWQSHQDSQKKTLMDSLFTERSRNCFDIIKG